ncbi:MAG: serine hydrolase domain-containing protein [Cyclobacteriaceae bacterium]
MIIKRIKQALLLVVILGLGYGISYLWQALPIISGFGAKDMCTCVFVNGRTADDVRKQELGAGLQSLGSFTVNPGDPSVSGSVFGLAKRKAIFRKGLGCTLLAELSEEEVRQQPIRLHAFAPINPDTVPWPLGDRTTDTLMTGVNAELLNQALDFAFTEKDPERPINTRAVIVVYRDQIVAERYAPGFDRNSRHMGWSMTKSVNSAAVGVLVKQGKLNVNEPAPVPEWQQDERKNITLEHLLQASSGLKWEEVYSGPSGATNMLFKKANMAAYAAARPLDSKPNTVFEYSSGTSNILARIVRQAVGDEDYYRFYYRELLEKIGAQSFVLEPDASGTYVSSSYSWATARDWARFGLLYLHDGVVHGERLLPEGWVKYSATPSPAAPRGEYGAQWWLNAGAPANPANRTYPDVPVDSFQAEGFEGQFVFVIPSKNLVVVRLGLSQKADLDMNAFVSRVMAALPAN